jgi:hypothetical protein
VADGVVRTLNTHAESCLNSESRDDDNTTQVLTLISDWRRRLRAEPDERPREGERGLREQALVRALLAAASAPQEGVADQAMLHALAVEAANYGADQPRHRLDPEALVAEMSVLRDVVWRLFRDGGSASHDLTDRILRFDRALSVAIRAALVGGFSDDGAARSRIPEQLRMIVAGASPPARTRVKTATE